MVVPRMFLIRKPSNEQNRETIEAQTSLDFTYPMVGATRNAEAPSGFVVDHNRIQLGEGEEVFEIAKRALADWQHYRFSWLELHRPESPLEAGQTVATVARALGLWVLNVCRIVYFVGEDQPLRRSGFAYGTLPEHAECGEERFQVEWHADDSVWYDIFAFSRPHQLLARIGKPYVRLKQRQFARDSLAAMKDAVSKLVQDGRLPDAD